MNNRIFILILLLLGFKADAQFNEYQFTHFQKDYEELTNPIKIEQDTFWIDTSYTNLAYDWNTGAQFKFSFQGVINSFSLSPFNKVRYNRPVLYLITNNVQVFVPLAGNMRMQEPNKTAPFVSSFTYEIDTMSKPRIMKFQYKNIGLADSLRQIKGHYNMQLWLFENGAIEYHFGDIQAPIGVYYHDSSIFKCMISCLNFNFGKYYSMLAFGNENNPVFLTTNTDSTFDLYGNKDSSFKHYPTKGTVYRFYNKNLEGLFHPELNDDMSVYPNPTNSLVTIDNPGNIDLELNVRNAVGQIIQHKQDHQTNTINLKNEPNGIYFLEIKRNNGVKIIKLLKCD